MAKKAVQHKMEEVKFTIAKDAFKPPFKCHGVTEICLKKLEIDKNLFTYTVWKCPGCGKEYLDTQQAKRLEAIWTFEKLCKDDVFSMNRSINFDGKMFFIRFPKEFTKNWKKQETARIKAIDAKRFVVEVV